jgi:septum formation protein
VRLVSTLILASSSRYRADLLARLGLEFDAEAPEIDESPRPGEPPADLVRRLSHLKAAAIAARRGDALVIGSDQVAVVGERILGKPGSAAVAHSQLALLSGSEVTFHTGLCLLDSRDHSHQIVVVPTVVQFRTLTRIEIEDYVRREQPLDCAGAFKSEGLCIALFERITSDDPSALIGLPLIALCRMLRKAGVPLLGPGTLA